MNRGLSRLTGAINKIPVGLTAKIMGAGLIPLALVIILGIVGLWGLRALIKNNQLLHHAQRVVEDASDIQVLATEMESVLRGYLLTGREEFANRYEEVAGRADEKFNALRQKAKTGEGTDAEVVQLLAEAQKNLKDWREQGPEKLIKGRRERGVIGPGQIAEIIAVHNVRGYLDACRQALEKLRTLQDTAAGSYEAKAQRQNRNAELLLLAIIPASALITLGLFLVISRAITSNLLRVIGLAESISKGQLTLRIKCVRKDELGRMSAALNGMVDQLDRQLLELTEGMNVLSSSASQITSTASQLAAGVAKTSSAVTQAGATVEEVRQAARLSGERARRVSEASLEAVKIAEGGKRATEDTIGKINQISKQMDSISDTVLRLNEHSQAIQDIIGSVQDLADQSNLLAVNAAIEAARAGEQGKGFAVVAQEIKRLADQSRQATNKIRSILEDTRKRVGEVVMATEEGGRAVRSGVEQSIRAGESIQKLSDTVLEASQAAVIIDKSTDQQFVGIDQVSDAMKSIEHAMSQSLQATGELEYAAVRLGEVGEALKDLVGRYEL